MKWFSFRLWVAGLAVGLMGSVVLTALSAPGWLAGGLGLMIAVAVVWIMVNDPTVVLNCPHCGRMIKGADGNLSVCAKCGHSLRTPEGTQPLM